eukprot:524388_1
MLLKKSQCCNFYLGHMIDWDALFNLQKNKSIDITVSIVQCHQWFQRGITHMLKLVVIIWVLRNNRTCNVMVGSIVVGVIVVGTYVVGYEVGIEVVGLELVGFEIVGVFVVGIFVVGLDVIGNTDGSEVVGLIVVGVLVVGD